MTIANRIHLTDREIRTALEPYGPSLTDVQVQAIWNYISLLLLWNQKVRLTSVVEPNEIVNRHFGESMFAVRKVPIERGRLADIGSGAGFPGLALKIACPQLEVFLIEANAKKAAFLAEAKRALQLEGVEILRTRLEDLSIGHDTLDFVTARAVGGLLGLLFWSQRALSRQGKLVLWLGREDAEEISGTAGWKWREPVLIPGSRRRVVLIGQPESR